MKREAIEAAVRPAKTQMRYAKRAQALLLLAAGVDNPVEKLADAPRSGRPPSLSRTPTRRGSKPKRVDHPQT